MMKKSDEFSFTVEDSFNRKNLLSEALEIVSYSDVFLGPKEKDKPVFDVARKNVAIKRLEKLEEEHALFSPKLNVRAVKKSDFENKQIQLTGEIANDLEKNDAYFINIPITLFARSGWAFTRLECWLGFCYQEEDKAQCPVIYEMFPEDVWETILSFKNQLNIGLDESLSFRAQVDKLEGKWMDLSGEAQAKVSVSSQGKANLVLGPFFHQIKRSKVKGRGRGNIECFWRLDSNAHVDQEDVMLGIVLMVPKGRKRPVNVMGQLKAYHDFQAWSADFRDWFHRFGDNIKALFNSGIVVEASEKWENIIDK